ncbi:MAG: dUTP diphosphatase [Ruminococcus sp.]|jgi:dUTP pyrophosphatase|nr:dUTP diphosphatase [Ruminococcus sp.]
MEKIKIKKLSSRATIPTRATDGSAGYDLYTTIHGDTVLKSGESRKFPTGIAIEIDNSSIAGFVYARSGIAAKYGVAPANCVGIIDSDYRGEIMVTLHNHSQYDFKITPNMRIAQLVFAPVILPEFELAEELKKTERQDGGFGSTGI